MDRHLLAMTNIVTPLYAGSSIIYVRNFCLFEYYTYLLFNIDKESHHGKYHNKFFQCSKQYNSKTEHGVITNEL